MKTFKQTIYICNVCGQEYSDRNDAVECHPDIVEEERDVITYKTRSGKTVHQMLQKEAV